MKLLFMMVLFAWICFIGGRTYEYDKLVEQNYELKLARIAFNKNVKLKNADISWKISQLDIWEHGSK